MMLLIAINALRKYRGVKPENVAECEGLEVKEIIGVEHFDDAIIGKTILLPKGLMRHQRKWRIAHCLGHYFMCHGNQAWCENNGISFRPKQERQADIFATCLLTGMDYDNPWLDEVMQMVKAGKIRR